MTTATFQRGDETTTVPEKMARRPSPRATPGSSHRIALLAREPPQSGGDRSQSPSRAGLGGDLRPRACRAVPQEPAGPAHRGGDRLSRIDRMARGLALVEPEPFDQTGGRDGQVVEGRARLQG